MPDYKSWFASKTVWAGIIGFLASMPLVGKYVAGLDAGQIADTAAALITMVTGLVTIYGRITATAQVSKSAS